MNKTACLEFQVYLPWWDIPSISSGYFPGGTSYKRSPARVATVSGRLEMLSKKFSKPRETRNAGIPVIFLF